MKKFVTIFFSSLLFLVAYAQAAEDNHVRGEIIVDEKQNPALVLTMEDGWYTYWRMAGDNGLPPKLDWSSSQNLGDIKISWPIPSRYTMMDMHSFGYKDQVVFPLSVSPLEKDKIVMLGLSADLVVCKDICIPANVKITQDISSARKDDLLMQSAVKKLPLTENIPDLGMKTAVLGKDALVVTAYASDAFAGGADLIVETSSPILLSPPEIIADEGDKTQAVLKIKAPAGMDLAKELFGKKATLLLIHNGKAIEKEFSF